MNDNAKLWVDVLRSGEYQQTTSMLHNDEGYCCLGVACDLYMKQTGDGLWSGDPVSDFLTLEDEPRTLSLPTPVRRWLGLQDNDGVYDGCALTYKNDNGATFEQIADIIEAEPEGLFAFERVAEPAGSLR